MANQDQRNLPDRLLQAAISKSVAERLRGLDQEFSELTESMTEADAKAAKLMILEMMRNACGDFYVKVKARLENQIG